MKWPDVNPKSAVAVILAITVCTVLISSVAAALLYPPGTVTETFRQKIFEVLIYIIGMVGGWLLGKGDPLPPPDKPQDKP